MLLHGLPRPSLAELARLLKLSPRTGTEHEELLAVSQHFLKVQSAGENSYTNGMAIANLRRKATIRHKGGGPGRGHYVLLLGKWGERIRLYCPLLGVCLWLDETDFEWCNGAGTLRQWSLNFGSLLPENVPSFYAEPHHFFLADPLSLLKLETDSSFLLYQTLRQEQEEIASWHEAKDLSLFDGQLYLSGLPVLHNDAVWLRRDPLNSVDYYEMLRLLSHVRMGHFFNRPQHILLWHDKLTTAKFLPQTLAVAANADAAANIWHHFVPLLSDRCVVKVPSLFGGEGVVIASCLDEVLQNLPALLQASGYVIMQPFFATGERQVDTRVLVTAHTVLGCVDRVAQEGSLICNLSRGGRANRRQEPLPEQWPLIHAVQQFMRDEGVFMAGLDFMGAQLIEVNISCPSTLVDINQLNGAALQHVVLQEARDFYPKTLHRFF